MASTLWAYLRNPFDNITKSSLKQMNLLAKDHHDKLKGAADVDGRFAPMYQQLLPFYENFNVLYIKSSSNGNLYQARTQTVERLFVELSSTKARQWDVMIQYYFDETSPEYKSLIPNGRSVFQSGGYETKIREVKTLATTMLEYGQLANLQQEVAAFGDELETARTIQQNFEREAGRISRALELARQELALEMHSIFGQLIGVYYKDISFVETFYDMEYLRTAQNSSADTSNDALVLGDDDMNGTNSTSTTNGGGVI